MISCGPFDWEQNVLIMFEKGLTWQESFRAVVKYLDLCVAKFNSESNGSCSLSLSIDCWSWWLAEVRSG
jgi:hypothetical protein